MTPVSPALRAALLSTYYTGSGLHYNSFRTQQYISMIFNNSSRTGDPQLWTEPFVKIQCRATIAILSDEHIFFSLLTILAHIKSIETVLTRGEDSVSVSRTQIKFVLVKKRICTPSDVCFDIYLVKTGITKRRFFSCRDSPLHYVL